MFPTAPQRLRRKPESMKLRVAHILAAIVWGIAPNLWAAAPPPTPAPAAAPTSDWSFGVSPYLWIAGVEVETTLDVSPPGAPPCGSRFETKLSGGALLAAQVRYKSVGLWLDFVWVQTDTNSVQPGPAF